MAKFTTREIARLHKNVEATRQRVELATSFLEPRRQLEAQNVWLNKRQPQQQEEEEPKKKKKNVDREKKLEALYSKELRAWQEQTSAAGVTSRRAEEALKKKDETLKEISERREKERRLLEEQRDREALEGSEEGRLVKRILQQDQANQANQALLKEKKPVDEFKEKLMFLPSEQLVATHIIHTRPSDLAARLSLPSERQRLQKALGYRILSSKLVAATGGRFSLDLTIASPEDDPEVTTFACLVVDRIEKLPVSTKTPFSDVNREDRALAADKKAAEYAVQRALDDLEDRQELIPDVPDDSDEKAKEYEARLKVDADARRAEEAAQRALDAEKDRALAFAALEEERRRDEAEKERARAVAEQRKRDDDERRQRQKEPTPKETPMNWEFWRDHDRVAAERRAASDRLRKAIVDSWGQESTPTEPSVVVESEEDNEEAVRAELWAQKARDEARKLLAHEHYAAYVARQAERDDERAAEKADLAKAQAQDALRRDRLQTQISALPLHIQAKLPMSDHAETSRDVARRRREDHFKLAAGRPTTAIGTRNNK